MRNYTKYLPFHNTIFDLREVGILVSSKSCEYSLPLDAKVYLELQWPLRILFPSLFSNGGFLKFAEITPEGGIT